MQLYRQVGDKRNEPVALYNLGEAHYYLDPARAQDYYEQALSYWHLTGDRRYEAAVLSRVGIMIAERRGDLGQAIQYCGRAERLSVEVNDRLGQMSSHYSLAHIHILQNDYLESRVHAERALQLCGELGNQSFAGETFGMLGRIADQLGDYASAFENHNRGLSILRELGERNLICQGLTALGALSYHSGKPENAIENCRRALLLARETSNRTAQSQGLVIQGHALREMGQLDEAADCYRQALELAIDLDFPHLAMQVQTGLAAIAFARGNLVEAMPPMQDILDYLETHALSTLDEIFWIFISCYRILRAASDPRALPTLQAAHTLLQKIAAGIDDPALRNSFLQNVRSNRELLQAWETHLSP